MEHVQKIIEQLNNYAYNYYVLDNPTISDKEYDILYDELVALESSVGAVLPNSPTRRVGGDVLSGYKQYEHKHKLFSLDKAQSFEEVSSWIEKIEKDSGKVKYSCEYKFDGITINLTYNNGEFVRATTRGNGIVGEDVTAQVLTIKTFPLTIDYKGELEVVGEAIMYLSHLEKYNETATVPLKNARNAVAGAIRNLDPKETAKRKPHIVFYSINYIEDENLVDSQEESIEFLRKNKFKISPFFKVVDNFSDTKKILEDINEKRNQLDFLIDGAVLKVNSFKVRHELGFTEKFPKWAVAYKFEAEETTTVLEDVIWQVGRTGKLTPLAILQPQDLCGVTVSRATLNNFGDIQRKGVKINDRVFIRRSNDVIPEVLGLAERFHNAVDVVQITNCPDCGAEVYEKGANIFCSNELNCPTQIIARLTHFASKNAMDVGGFSEKTARTFYEKLNVKNTSDLYSIKFDDMVGLEGFKEKKIDNFIKAIEKSKNVTFDRFIYALGILNVGTKTAKDLAKAFPDMDTLKASTLEELLVVEEVGEIVASSILDFFADKVLQDNLTKLLEFIQIDYGTKQQIDGVLSGETVVLTGVLEHYKRGEATKLLENLGAVVVSAVTKKTTLVVFGDDAGSKLAKAEKLGIKLMSETEFIGLLK